MKKYKTKANGTCWRDAIGCILEIHPKRIPDFVKEYKNNYMDVTRVWLKENFNKGLVYIPSREFMETGKMRNNGPVGPTGYSIGHLTMQNTVSNHVVICYNGGVLYDNGDNRHSEYDVLGGYFVIHDLEPARAIWVKKPKKRKKKK